MEDGVPLDPEVLEERWIGYRAGFQLGVVWGVTVVGTMAGIIVFTFRHCIFG